MRVLLLGAGFIAQTHIQALRSIGITDILLVDRNEKQAQHLANTYNLQYVASDYHKISPDVEFDSVHICTIPSDHYAAIKHFLSLGKLVVCEKPLCLAEWQAKELETLLLPRSEQILICYNNRYYSGAQKASQAIGSAKYGRPLLLYGTYEQNFHLPPTPNSWRFAADDGNYLRAVSEIGSHLIDLVQFWTHSPIVKVSARFIKRHTNLYLNQQGQLIDQIDHDQECLPVPVKNEDIAIINLELQNACMANLLVSEVSAATTNDLRMTAIMEQARLHWQNSTADQLTISLDKNSNSILNLGIGSTMLDSYITMFKDFYGPNNSSSSTAAKRYQACQAAIENVIICAKLYESNQQNGNYLPVK